MQRKKDIIYDRLKNSIITGEYTPGMRLPPEIEFARSLGVGQITLRNALARLEKEELVDRIRHRGTFVREKLFLKNFLFLLPDGVEMLENPSRHIAAGTEVASRKLGVSIERCSLNLFCEFSKEERLELVKHHSISGIILETTHKRSSAKVIEAIRELNLPTVIPHGTSFDASETGFLVLRTGEQSAFRDAYLYLAKHGHTKIASLYAKISGEENPDLMRGFNRSSLREFLYFNDLAADNALIALCETTLEAVKEQIQIWLEQEEPPTAILCHSDNLAIKVYAVLRDMKISIPDEVSIFGYSNYPGSQLLMPALTTIDPQLETCAEIALKQLLRADEWYQKDTTPDEIFTPYQLIERQSVKTIAKANKKSKRS